MKKKRKQSTNKPYKSYKGTYLTLADSKDEAESYVAGVDKRSSRVFHDVPKAISKTAMSNWARKHKAPRISTKTPKLK